MTCGFSRSTNSSGPSFNRSNFFNFPNPFDPSNRFSFTLTSATPFSLGSNGILNSFTADISGDFSSEATPIPEPSLVTLFGLALIGLRASSLNAMRQLVLIAEVGG